MAVVPKGANPNYPFVPNADVFHGKPIGKIARGDFLIFSGQYVTAYDTDPHDPLMSSAAGIALDANPLPDQHGEWRDQKWINVRRRGKVAILPLFNDGSNVFKPPRLGQCWRQDTLSSAYNNPTGAIGRPGIWFTEPRSGYSASTGTENEGLAVVVDYTRPTPTGSPRTGQFLAVVNFLTRGYY